MRSIHPPSPDWVSRQHYGNTIAEKKKNLDTNATPCLRVAFPIQFLLQAAAAAAAAAAAVAEEEDHQTAVVPCFISPKKAPGGSPRTRRTFLLQARKFEQVLSCHAVRSGPLNQPTAGLSFVPNRPVIFDALGLRPINRFVSLYPISFFLHTLLFPTAPSSSISVLGAAYFRQVRHPGSCKPLTSPGTIQQPLELQLPSTIFHFHYNCLNEQASLE